MIPDVIKKLEIVLARGIYRTLSNIYDAFFAKIVTSFELLFLKKKLFTDQGLFQAKTESDFWMLPLMTYFFQKFVLSKQL